jgi:hypothetical protein
VRLLGELITLPGRTGHASCAGVGVQVTRNVRDLYAGTEEPFFLANAT